METLFIIYFYRSYYELRSPGVGGHVYSQSEEGFIYMFHRLIHPDGSYHGLQTCSSKSTRDPKVQSKGGSSNKTFVMYISIYNLNGIILTIQSRVLTLVRTCLPQYNVVLSSSQSKMRIGSLLLLLTQCPGLREIKIPLFFRPSVDERLVLKSLHGSQILWSFTYVVSFKCSRREDPCTIFSQNLFYN